MLLDQLVSQMNVALKSGDKFRTETLRFLIAAIKKYEIDTYPPGSTTKLTDDDVTKIIRRQVKTHEESIAAFLAGKRQDLVDKETAELKILQSYLPQELDESEIQKIVEEVIGRGLTNFGQVMGAVMKQLAGRASGDRVQKLVKEKLAEV